MHEKLALLGGPAAAPGLSEFQPVTPAEAAAVHRSLMHTPMTSLYGGHDIGELERRFVEFFGCGHAVTMTSGTSSLHAALSALDIGVGDEVITTTYSFVASASVIVQQGATPVFCDIEADTLNIDVAQCAKLITPKTRAILPVHVFGKPADLVALRRLCDDAGIALVEDCAGAAGARIGGRYAGTFGDISCFSFNIHKVIRTGEGGMACARDARLAQILREVRVNGLNPDTGVNNVVRLGYNYTMPQAIAALGCVQLESLGENLAARERNRRILQRTCQDLRIALLPEVAGSTSVGYWTPLLLSKELLPVKSLILRALRAEGVFAHGGYGRPLYEIEYLKHYAHGRDFAVSAEVCPRVICIDPSPWFSETQMQAIAAAVRKVFSSLDVLARAA